MTEIENLKAEVRALRREVEYLKNSLLPDVSMPRVPLSPPVDFGRITAGCLTGVAYGSKADDGVTTV